MSKKLNVKAAEYTAEYTAIHRTAEGATLTQGTIKADSKGAREIKKAIAAQENVNTADVILGTVSKKVSVTTYKVNATNAEILDACAAAGLSVEIIAE